MHKTFILSVLLTQMHNSGKIILEMECDFMKKLNHEDILQFLPDRAVDSHKGDYGRILLLCGSRGYTGAAALAAMGALRCGAGLVYLAVPESIYQIEASKLLEPIVLPLPDVDGHFSCTAVKAVCELLPKMDAVLVGPGIGQSVETRALTEAVLAHFNGPVILDADGINVMKLNIDLLRDRTSPTVLTPHPGEFTGLGGDLTNGRIPGAEALAKDLNAIVVLKGHETVITDGQTTFVNPTGNPGMAVGGSGDVLAGMITSLIGQGLDPLMAAASGAWLHGAAGDLCARDLGQYAMLPSDMLNYLPRLLK